MKIHIFNPEHDIALASNLDNFTAPHAGRCLRHDLGFLPALYADRGDCVLVDDIDASREGLKRLAFRTEALLMDYAQLKRFLANLKDDVYIEPWGWDRALRRRLQRIGIGATSLPTDGHLDIIRAVSHRGWAARNLLEPLTSIPGTVGLAAMLASARDVEDFVARHRRIVIKAPWSSSGRGVRYVSADECPGGHMQPHLLGWVNNILRSQGSIMAEPYYNKVCDFGMEFTSDGRGTVDYSGLSLFHTQNAAYTGNLIEEEQCKVGELARYVSPGLLAAVRQAVIAQLSPAFAGVYGGLFGIDMMVVRQGYNLMLHPCVELNLRMTMGHVALALGTRQQLLGRVMRITYASQYRLRIEPAQSVSVSVEPIDGRHNQYGYDNKEVE